MSDINFVTDGTVERICNRRKRHEGVLRDAFANQAKNLQDDAERSFDYCRDLMRGGHDISEELKELETFAHGLMLAILLMKRQTTNANG